MKQDPDKVHTLRLVDMFLQSLSFLGNIFIKVYREECTNP